MEIDVDTRPIKELSTSAAIMAREDFYLFVRWMFFQRRGYVWRKGPQHQRICDALMRVYHGHCKRLIINVPPRYSKTEIAVINFISWTLGHCPDAEFIHGSYSGRLAGNNAWQARELVQSQEYREIFPEVELRQDSKARDEWRTTAGGVVYAVGAGGSITGYGAGKDRPGFGGAIILDDAHKADEAHSDIIREGVLDWFQNTIESRKNSPDTPIIVIMQRLHERDLSGWLLDGGNGEEWEHVCIPAVNQDDTALWPEKHTREELRRMEKAASYVFAGQYLQTPTPPGGGILKEKWWRQWDKPEPPPCDHTFCSWDTAFSEEGLKTNSASAMTRWGVWWSEQDQKYSLILLGAWHGWCDFPELLEQARSIHRDREPDRHLIEKKASGQSLVQTLRKAHISVYPYQPDRDKVARAYAVQAMLEGGQVWYMPSKEWAQIVVSMCAKFPMGASPSSDYTDTCTQAWLYLRNGWWVSGHPDDPNDDEDGDAAPARKPRKFYG